MQSAHGLADVDDLPAELRLIIFRYLNHTMRREAAVAIQTSWRRYRAYVLVKRYLMLRYLREFRRNPRVSVFLSARDLGRRRQRRRAPEDRPVHERPADEVGGDHAARRGLRSGIRVESASYAHSASATAPTGKVSTGAMYRSARSLAEWGLRNIG